MPLTVRQELAEGLDVDGALDNVPGTGNGRDGYRLPRASRRSRGRRSGGAAERLVSSVIPNGRPALRTGPLEALIIGGWVRGLSDRDVESLVTGAGSGQISKSTRPISNHVALTLVQHGVQQHPLPTLVVAPGHQHSLLGAARPRRPGG
jgi:hypothetical protein